MRLVNDVHMNIWVPVLVHEQRLEEHVRSLGAGLHRYLRLVS